MSMDDWFEDVYQSQLSQSSALGEVLDEENLLAAFDLQMQLADAPALALRKEIERVSTNNALPNMSRVSGKLCQSNPGELIKDRSAVENLAQMVGEDLAQMDNWLEEVFETHMVFSQDKEDNVPCEAQTSEHNVNKPGWTFDEISDHPSLVNHVPWEAPTSENNLSKLGQTFDEITDHASLVRLCMLKDEWRDTPSKHEEEQTSRRSSNDRRDSRRYRRGSPGSDSHKQVLKRLDPKAIEMPSWLQPMKRAMAGDTGHDKARQKLRGEWMNFIEVKRDSAQSRHVCSARNSADDDQSTDNRPGRKPRRRSKSVGSIVKKRVNSKTELETRSQATPRRKGGKACEKKKRRSRRHHL